MKYKQIDKLLVPRKRDNGRWVLADNATGRTIDDAEGKGFRTRGSAIRWLFGHYLKRDTRKRVKGVR